MKFLLVVVVVVVGLWLMLGRNRGDAARRPPGSARGRKNPAQPMVECAHCGLHLPADDAVRDGSRSFCSEAHRLLGPRPAAPP